jgi:hypothetical protein
MQVKETRVSQSASSFIMKAGASLIPSPIMKAGTSPFIMKVGVSLIPYIKRRALEWRISVSYPS